MANEPRNIAATKQDTWYADVHATVVYRVAMHPAALHCATQRYAAPRASRASAHTGPQTPLRQTVNGVFMKLAPQIAEPENSLRK